MLFVGFFSKDSDFGDTILFRKEASMMELLVIVFMVVMLGLMFYYFVLPAPRIVERKILKRLAQKGEMALADFSKAESFVWRIKRVHILIALDVLAKNGTIKYSAAAKGGREKRKYFLAQPTQTSTKLMEQFLSCD